MKVRITAGYLTTDQKKITAKNFIEMKQRGEKISMLTAYDFTTAGILDRAGVDCILIGDSASNVMAGNDDTLPITVDQMIYHARSVARAVKRAMVLCDMPFGSYQASKEEGVRNACRMMKESGANGLKLEGGIEIIDTVKAIIAAGIPVCGHLGLTPQSVNKFGGYGSATIGIGAGPGCDGQVLVYADALGMTQGFQPKFLRRFANVAEVMTDGVGDYVRAVKDGSFPNEQESY